MKENMFVEWEWIGRNLLMCWIYLGWKKGGFGRGCLEFLDLTDLSPARSLKMYDAWFLAFL